MSVDLQQLNRDIINRRANGKTIFQPRICCWYDDRMYRGEELEGEYKGLSRIQLYEKLGCSDRLYYFNACMEAKLDPSIKSWSRPAGERRTELIMETPVGTVNSIVESNASNPGVMPIKWWVEEEKDLEVFSFIEETTEYSFNMERYEQMCQEMGHLGLPSMFVPRVNMQHMIVTLSGVINTVYLLNDSTDAVESFFKSLSIGQEKMMKVAAECPIEWINYGDNLHCKILPPDLFKKYVIPEYQKRGEILHKAGKFVFSHFDGDVKDFLPYVHDCALDGIEAITPLPQGDVTVEEVKAALKDDIFLVDGSAAILFSDLYPVEDLKKQAEQIMNLFEGQLVLGISDEFPSDGKLDRLKVVNEMVQEFNAKR